MKKLLAFLFILNTVFAYAQDTAHVKAVKTKRFFVGINFSPDICEGILTKPILDNLGLKSISKFGFTSGINSCFVITKHISIDFGVQYSKKEVKVTSDLTFGDMIDRRRGFVYNTNELNFGYSIYNYLDIPLKANFIFGKRKTRFISSVGLTTNILLKATGSFYTGNNYSRINLSPTISAGIDYKINRKQFFRIEPTFRYGVLKVSDNLATQYLWNAGINVSWYFL
ncbi:MAG: hypothetical protein ABI388_06815 [Bacteroidia bacterium]